jgi:hypothetical protein
MAEAAGAGKAGMAAAARFFFNSLDFGRIFSRAQYKVHKHTHTDACIDTDTLTLALFFVGTPAI